MTPEEQKEFEELEAAEQAEKSNIEESESVDPSSFDKIEEVQDESQEDSEVNLDAEDESLEDEKEEEPKPEMCKVLKRFYVRDSEKRIVQIGESISTSLITQEHIDLKLVELEA